MYVILGATGHVGAAAATALLDAGERVCAVTRDEAKAAEWRARGAQAEVADVHDTERLRAVFRRGRRAFLLNPPAPVSGDTDAQERATAAAIVAALTDSGLEKVVLESTYGAQPGERIGDLSVLYGLEQALAAQPIPATVLRAAYYMSNWDAMLAPAREGTLPTMLPAGLPVPMVAPEDLGRAAARLLRAPVAETGIHPVEGPRRYTPEDVAAAFAQALGRPVTLAVTPRDRWEAAFREQGFSAEAADAYARMTAVSVDSGFDVPGTPERGSVTLDAYIAGVVERNA